MSAIQALLEKVKQEQVEREAQEKFKAKSALAEAREWFESNLGANLLAELQAEYTFADNGYHTPCAKLTYRGYVKDFRNISGYSNPDYGSEKNIHDWIIQVDTTIEAQTQHKSQLRETLLRDLPECDFRRTDEYFEQACKYGIDSIPEIAEAFKQARAREQAYRDEQKAIEQARREAFLAEYADMIERARTAKTREDLQGPYNFLGDHQWNIPDSELLHTIEEADTQFASQEEALEKRRKGLEAEAFHPFVYYRVVYGIVAHDDEESFVQTDDFPCLTHEPDPAGWWMPANSRIPVKIKHLAKVERHEVLEPDDTPRWCPLVDTGEAGKIRVPPAFAEKITEEA